MLKLAQPFRSPELWADKLQALGSHCDANGRSTDNISISSERRGTKSTAIQIGGVLQYKLAVYCDAFLRSSGSWGF